MYNQGHNFSPPYRRFEDERLHHPNQNQQDHHPRSQSYNRTEYSHDHDGGKYHHKERGNIYDPPEMQAQQSYYHQSKKSSIRSPSPPPPPPRSNFIVDDKSFVAIGKAIISELEDNEFLGRNARERSSAVVIQLQKMMSIKQLIDLNDALKSRLARFGPPYRNMSQMEMLVHQCDSSFGEELEQLIRQKGSVSELFHSPRHHHRQQPENQPSSSSYSDHDNNFQRVYSPEVHNNDLTNHIIYDVKVRDDSPFNSETMTKSSIRSNNTAETSTSSCDDAGDSEVYTIALEDIKEALSPTLLDNKIKNKMSNGKVRFQDHKKNVFSEDTSIATPTRQISNQTKREKVEVVAPAALPENFTFEARKGDELFMVSVVSSVSKEKLCILLF